MIRSKKLDQAQQYLDQIPKESAQRGSAELKMGQALWASYLESSRQIRDWENGVQPTPEGTDIASMKPELEELKSRFGFVREIRGEGLMLGLELSVEGAPFVAEALDRGLVINCTHDFTLRFLPPFIVGERQVREFLLKLESVFNRGGSVATAKKAP